MRTEDFDYLLPEGLIAQHPPKARGTSRLLTINKQTGDQQHLYYPDMYDFLQPGDVVVLNDTKVIKARLSTTNAEGKDREILLLEQHGHDFGIHTHKVLYRRKIHAGETLLVHGVEIKVEEVLDGGIAVVSSTENLLELSNHYGSVPLPPYMKRDASKEDIERYQTVFAQNAGSVAAPTASLNFTNELEQRLTSKGVHVVRLTLHVGLGTFLPIRVDDVTKHQMHSEYFEIPKATVLAIQNAKENGRKVLAVGTTVARTLEYSYQEILNKEAVNLSGEADIFIYPGYEFKVVGMLLTNFHAPRTTVLMLTAAFASWENLKSAYENAVQKKYAFLSYGDSMLIY